MNNPALNKAKRKAQAIVQDNQRLQKLLTGARDKLAQTESVDSLYAKSKVLISLLIRMVKAWAEGRYKEVPWRSLFLIVVGLVYFLMPLDAIPDFIPIAGLIDDFSVIIWIGQSVKGDILAYREWEERQIPSVEEPTADQSND